MRIIYLVQYTEDQVEQVHLRMEVCHAENEAFQTSG